jgi:elongation factor 2 kinase
MQDTDRHRDKGLDLMRRVAASGCREALVYVARNCDSRGPDFWLEAVDWYEKALECEEEAGDSGIAVDPKYGLLARIAEIYTVGGEGLDQDMQRAGELYTEAAELAMESMKGKLANKYYALAEEAWAAAE